MSSIELPSELIRTALSETAEKLLGTADFEITVTAGSAKGDNFVGDCYRVACRRANETEPALKLFVKVAPQHKQRRAIFSSEPCFLQEIHLFDKVLSHFDAFEQSKGIERGDRFHEYAVCYKTLDAAPFECLVFEDLAVDDFVMLNHREESITGDHMNLVMAALGKFHALSFAVRHQQPEVFKQLVAPMNDGALLRINEKLLNNTADHLFEIADALDDAELAAKVRHLYTGDIPQLLYASVRDELIEPYGVICHADGWNNNLMFRLDANRRPLEVRILDYQMARYGPPVLDVLYFIFCCTQKDVRDEHYEHFLRIYHASLAKHLERLGPDVAHIYPYQTMLEQLQKCGKFGLYIATLEIPMLTSNPRTNPDLEQLSEKVGDRIELSDNYFITAESAGRSKERLRDVIVDMQRLGYI